jgi:lysozyme
LARYGRFVFDRIQDGLAARAARFQVGVDVASFQGRPADWRAAAGRITWAAVKMTELEPRGIEYVNPDAGADWAFLERNKKGRIGYLFAHPSTGVDATVSLFARHIRALGLKDEDGIAVDLETSDGLGPAEVDRWSLDLLETLSRRLHRTPLLYTFLSFAEAGNCARLGPYPLWIADPDSPRGQPRVPAPWKKWAVHQYVLTGPIDRDVANYASRKAMFKKLGKQEEPDVQKLGGSFVGALASARWPDGVTVVAGLGKNGFIQAARYADGKWSSWRNVSPDKALGAPGLITYSSGTGHLYYTDTTGEVIELLTTDMGETWS